MEFAQALIFILRMAALAGCCAAAVTFAAAWVCQLMHWAPINITIVTEPRGERGE